MAALVLLVVFTSLYGQDAGKFALGARGGFNIVVGKISNDFKTLLTNNNSKEAAMPGGDFAVFGTYGFTNMLALQTELNFLFAQGKAGRRKEDTSSYFKISYSTLDIPLLLKVNFLSTQTRFGALGGPYVTFPLGKASTKFGGGYIDSDFKNEIDAPNFGFTFGLYYGYAFQNMRLVIDLRYLQDIGKSTVKKWSEEGFDLKYLERRAIVISVGLEYTF